jgi:DNA-binding response OmpR family regulator
MSLVRERLDLPDIISEAAALVRELVERKGLALHVEVAEGLSQVMVDRTRIRQVLLNLLSNAVRFTEQGHIAVRCELYAHGQGRAANGTPLDHALAQGIALPEQPFVCVSVTDTGIGIRAEDMPAVFEKFRQVDGSSRRKVGGTGLGLAISKQFVELHGGWMWVESVYGQGSTFCFVLPAAGQAWVRSPLLDTGRRAPALPVGKAILVVDPDPRLGRLLERYLPTRRVIAVPELAQAGRALAETMPEVVLARVEAPRAEIEALCASLGLANAELTVVRAGQDDAGLPATGEGIHDYLLKPVAREELEASLRRLEHRPGQILIVEDDPDMMRLLVRLTARLAPGVRLQRAYSVQEAQATLQGAPPPDLVMLDLGLPDQSGYDLLHWMRHTHGLEAPVIIITGNPDPDMAALRLPEVTVWRPHGLSAPELVTLLDLLVEKLPSTYAAKHPRASRRRDKAEPS